MNGVAEERECSMCGGDADYIGSLGMMDYYRCKNCDSESGYRSSKASKVLKMRKTRVVGSLKLGR